MADDIATALSQGTGTAPPVTAGDPTGTGGTAPASGTGSAPAGQPGDDDFAPTSIKEYLAANPDHAPIVERVTSEFKRGLTPKLMERAELRKKLEGLDDASLQSLRELQRMAQTDPGAAAKWLRDYAATISPAAPQTLTQAPPPEYMTDGEQRLYQRVQDLEGRLEKTSAGFESLSLHQHALQVGDQFNKISTELGVEIPIDVRRQCFETSRSAGGQLSPTEVYFAKNRETILGRIAQKARDEASGVIQTKAAGGAGNPAGVTPRAGNEPEPALTEFKDILRDEIRKRST